jgi:hypothetical protein
MATLTQKIQAEQRLRELLEESGVPAPDAVEYGHTCIRLFWTKSKTVLVIDIDEPTRGDELFEAKLADLEDDPA